MSEDDEKPDQTKIIPVVGMPCTIQVGSDFYAGVVSKILSPRRIEIQRNNLDPMIAYKRKNGRWTEAGPRATRLVTLGEAYEHMDPSF